jgi:hypothetical protein
VLPQCKRQHWTSCDGSLRQRREVISDVGPSDDRIAPIVEADQLRQQLGALAVAVAFDAVDRDSHADIRR